MIVMKRILTALAIGVVSFSSHANPPCDAALSLAGNTSGFSCTPVAGAFDDVYTFTLPGSSFLTSSTVTTVVRGSADIDFSIIYIENVLDPGTHFDFTQTTFDPTEQWALNDQLLAAGNYELHLIGNQTTTRGSYGGDLTVTPVPEPETYALMLAGLGAMGFVARRRKSR
jgi:hypothetical protein